MLAAAPLVSRAVCYRCEKPAVTCVCDGIRRVHNRTSIAVLQHPRERLHPLGTARFIRLGFARSEVHVAWDAGRLETDPPAWLPAGAALLYPASNAADLARVAISERPRHLVVIDGTWHTARTLHRDKAWLRDLPAYRLYPEHPSRYRIRGEPESSYLSTLEAVIGALAVLEPETPGLDDLVRAFDRMIDRQLEFIGRGRSAPRERDRRPSAWRRVPRAFAEHFGRLVVAYAESARRDPNADRELVHLTAVAIRTGARFERIIRPSFGSPSALHLRHMRLESRAFAGAPDGATAASDFRTFLSAQGEGPLLAAWSQGTLDLIAEQMATPRSRISLKAAYRRAHPGEKGDLDRATASFDIGSYDPEFQGRANQRTRQSVAIARHLHALAGFED